MSTVQANRLEHPCPDEDMRTWQGADYDSLFNLERMGPPVRDAIRQVHTARNPSTV